jgi:putative ABC transport system permease protein
MASLLLEIRQAWRGLLRSPGYSAGVVLTLGLGIAAVASVFALVDGVLLRSLPYPEADELVLVRQQNPESEWNTSVVDFRAIESESRSFEAVAAMQSMDVVLTGGAQPQWVSARKVTARFFDVMGVSPARGRGFHPGEDQPAAAPVVVLGHAFADRHFGPGSDPIGRTLTLDGVAHTVVGVMPPGVAELPGMRAELWPAMRLEQPARRGPFLFNTVARLKPGVTIEQASADLAALSRRLFPLWQQGFQDATALLTPRSLQAAIVGDSGRFLWIAMGAVLVVLLIAIVNVANLVLMRATERMRDLAVRAALGASRKRLARFLITENLLLAAVGGLAGLGLASLLLTLYRGLGPELPRLVEVGIDARVAGFVALVVLANGLLLGLVPLLFAGGGKGSLVHQEQGTAARSGQHLLRNGLVACEFALTLPLLVAAGLLINSLLQLQRVDPGFEAGHLLTARVALPETSYPDEPARIAFWERALPELRSIPGVVAVGIAAGVPPDAPFTFNNFDLVGRPAAQGSQPMSPWTPVMPGFFEALGVRLLEGRSFNASDTPDSAEVLLVSEAWARRYFPGDTAVGKQLYEGGDRTTPVTIVGVTSDVKFAGLDQPGEAVYAPISQGWPNNPAYVYLRTGPEPLALAEPLRSALARLDPALVPAEVTTMKSRLAASLGVQRHWATVLVGFALLAVLLSAVGVSGVLAYYVSRQRTEIGIRMALGADARQVLGMVIRRGLGCALAGSLLGVVLASVLTRGLESLLFQVERTDLPTLVIACVLLLVIALAACWLPARRAARIDPMVALRLE